MRPLLPLLILFILSDTIAAVIGARALWGLGKINSLGRHTGILLTALAIERACQLIAISMFRPVVSNHPLYITIILCAATIRSCAIWLIVLFIVGFHQTPSTKV